MFLDKSWANLKFQVAVIEDGSFQKLHLVSIWKGREGSAMVLKEILLSDGHVSVIYCPVWLGSIGPDGKMGKVVLRNER